jgi:Ser/Thr protein kinase RdoA (MazF antagonist)
MGAEEKAAAFDLLVAALTNRWADGRYSWWCPSPCGGPLRDAPADVVPDLLDWAEQVVKWRAKRAPVGPGGK